ncbi:MAG: hypothetical protein DMF68_19945 [Acidobacteria bacterium]|nr:MAG: hypothetical protein DMF68_19945 [Acidobacteriota bacterium]
MTLRKDFLDHIRIASPCSVGWENMTGDDRVRFCDQCNLHVYNISEMTRGQVSSLIAKAEGRICAKLYRRADGTVLTRDCPVGLRALRRRVSKMAGALLAALLSICSGAFGQTQSQKKEKSCTVQVGLKAKKTDVKDEQGSITGVLTDAMGAVIPGAKITLINERTKEQLTATSTTEGAFKFSNLVAGEFSLKVETAGFKTLIVKKIVMKADEVVRATLTLEFKGKTEVIGIFVSEPDIDSSNGTTIIRGEALQKLPLPK